MTVLDRAQVLHVARLARLELSEAEVQRMAAELSNVLDHFEQIRELDLEGVPPTSHVVDVAGVVRPDEPEPCLPREVVLAAAPEPVQSGFGVPSPGPGDDDS
jgi:aspartyl-tRNA(Asn)/glutamyl-tRNA(Gln) amidotransferase subunit C